MEPGVNWLSSVKCRGLRLSSFSSAAAALSDFEEESSCSVSLACSRAELASSVAHRATATEMLRRFMSYGSTFESDEAAHYRRRAREQAGFRTGGRGKAPGP